MKAEHGWLERTLRLVVARSARHPWVVLGLCLCLGYWGHLARKACALDALPDLSETQVILRTRWPGQSPDLVEDQVSYPLSRAMATVPHIKVVRAKSFFGISYVYGIFDEGTDLYWARARTLEALNQTQNQLPEGVSAELGPDATGVGWVYQYALSSPSGEADLAELRRLQDYVLRYGLEEIPAVAEVASVGGAVKEYSVEVDPKALRAHRLSLKQVRKAVARSNLDSAGRSLEIGGHRHVLRGRGRIRSLEDLREIALGAGRNGQPILLKDVASVRFERAPSEGLADLNGKGDAVGGIVVMRQGENAKTTIAAVKERLGAIKATLPKGVEITTVYDRSKLIDGALTTLSKTLLKEMLVVSLVIFFFLWNAKSALVPLVSLPMATLLAFLPLYAQGTNLNIMSLGGIAIALGAMVDASLVLIENVHRHLEGKEGASSEERREIAIAALQEVAPSIFVSLLIMTLGFLPIFALTGSEGRLFRPLAYTKTYAMGLSSVLAVTLTPALAVLLLKGNGRRQAQNPLLPWLERAYRWLLWRLLRVPVSTLLLAAAVLLLSLPLFAKFPRKFLPPLDEGDLLFMPTAPPGIGHTSAAAALQSMDEKIRHVPEVASVFGKMGRSTSATDSAPLGMAEVNVRLRPKSQWRPGLTRKGLLQELNRRVTLPGFPNLWWMPVQTRLEMLSTGIRSPLALQIQGTDQTKLAAAAVKAEKLLNAKGGSKSVVAARSAGGFYLDLVLRRKALARYGLQVADLQTVIATAIGGSLASEVIEGRERYGVRVRYQRDYRQSVSALRQVQITTPGGAQLPLSEFVALERKQGPPVIRSENGQLVTYVFIDPIGSASDYLKAVSLEDVRKKALAKGQQARWVGTDLALARAQSRLLKVLVPTLVAMLLLIYAGTRSPQETLLVVLAVPFSLIGALWLLYVLKISWSVAVLVGLVALVGLDIETGMVMLLYLRTTYEEWRREGKITGKLTSRRAIVEGAAGRLRPKLMTVLTSFFGLLPILWNKGMGSELLRPMAAPMVGGLFSSFALELLLYPILYSLWKGASIKETPEGGGGGEKSGAEPAASAS